MTKCRKCGTSIEYLEYHCAKCRKIMSGAKPKKSKDLCIGCTRNWYNQNKELGCPSYKSSKVVIKDVYHSLSQVVPNPTWKLECFLTQY